MFIRSCDKIKSTYFGSVHDSKGFAAKHHLNILRNYSLFTVFYETAQSKVFIKLKRHSTVVYGLLSGGQFAQKIDFIGELFS